MPKKSSSITIRCRRCGGTGHAKLTRKQQETADAFNGQPKTCNEVREMLVKQGKLKERKGKYDTSIHTRTDRLEKVGVVKRVALTRYGWTFVKV